MRRALGGKSPDTGFPERLPNGRASVSAEAVWRFAGFKTSTPLASGVPRAREPDWIRLLIPKRVRRPQRTLRRMFTGGPARRSGIARAQWLDWTKALRGSGSLRRGVEEA